MSTTFPYRVFCRDDASDQSLVVFDVMASDIALAVSEARAVIEACDWGYPGGPEWIDVAATVSAVLGAEFVAERAPFVDFVVTVRNQHVRSVGS